MLFPLVFFYYFAELLGGVCFGVLLQYPLNICLDALSETHKLREGYGRCIIVRTLVIVLCGGVVTVCFSFSPPSLASLCDVASNDSAACGVTGAELPCVLCYMHRHATFFGHLTQRVI